MLPCLGALWLFRDYIKAGTSAEQSLRLCNLYMKIALLVTGVSYIMAVTICRHGDLLYCLFQKQQDILMWKKWRRTKQLEFCIGN